MLAPNITAYTNKEIFHNSLKCYLWALFNCGQLEEFDFYPKFYRTFRTWVVAFDWGLIKVRIEGYQYDFDFFIPDSVWHCYLKAFEVPLAKRKEMLDPIPF